MMRHSALVELVGDRERAVAANSDEGIDRQRAETLDARRRDILHLAIGLWKREGVAVIRRAENRAALPENACDVREGQCPAGIRSDETTKAILDADRFNTLIGRCLDDGANDRVQSRGISAAGQDPMRMTGSQATGGPGSESMGTRHRRLSCGHVECRDGVYGQHSAAGVPDHRLCRRSEEQPIDGVASMSTNDNEVGRLLLCKSEKLTVRAAAHDDLFDSNTSRFDPFTI